MSFREFVAFLAACMALNALSTDVMIPALAQISAEFALADANQRQAVIAIYVFTMGVSQLIYGPLADRFGRKPVLIGGLTLYVVASLAATAAGSFAGLLAARALQGLGAGSPRVIAMALARDCYGGVQMGRIMSLVMMVFMAVPILAPSIGQLVLLVAPWRAIFAVLVIGGALLCGWTWRRLPETLHPEYRRTISVPVIAHGMSEIFRNRSSLGYTVAMSIMTGVLMAFITSIQQVFVDVYALDGRFTLYFGLMAIFLAVAAFTNARLVTRFGMRRLSHGALLAFVLTSALFVALAAADRVSLALFMVLETSLLFLFGFIGANFNVLALQPMAHVAGTASSMLGFLSITVGAVLGYSVGQHFDGSVLPLAAGNLLLGASAGLAVLFLVPRRGTQTPSGE